MVWRQRLGATDGAMLLTGGVRKQSCGRPANESLPCLPLGGGFERLQDPDDAALAHRKRHSIAV